MIGPKKLRRIREELQQALATAGDDPLRWLEERMTAPEHPGTSAGAKDVLHSLRRFLEAPGQKKRQTPRAGTKK